MGKTIKGAKKSIYYRPEYQSKRYPATQLKVGAEGKSITHKYERRGAKESLIKEELISSDTEMLIIEACIEDDEFNRAAREAYYGKES